MDAYRSEWKMEQLHASVINVNNCSTSTLTISVFNLVT